ncbi:RHS repeat protein [Undibacterium sp. CY18W]|uniref:RHS repeat protein n=1 Tax=Undibacterium hunanense TaxID=2762292 RepID=A0ABR6ZUC9_9BURK|nr:DUF6531 domain-containing protein [Undibacterium hunanense]MBC3919504.1 RHS repeat protein [Undibacterium hunanense]
MRKLIFFMFLLLLQSVAFALGSTAPGPKVGWADVDGHDPLFGTAEAYCAFKTKDNTNPLRVFGIAPVGSPYPNTDEQKTCVEHEIDAQGNPIGLANYLFYVLKLRICPGGSQLSESKTSCNCPTPAVWVEANAWAPAGCVVPKPKQPEPKKKPDCPNPPPEPEPNPGPEADPNPGCGDPIYPATGSVTENEVDFTVNTSGFNFMRSYSSNRTDVDDFTVRLFGRHWVSRFDSRIVQEPARAANTTDNSYCFSGADGGIFCPDQSQKLSGLTIPDTVSVARPNGSRNVFTMVNGVGVSDSDINNRLSTSLDANNKILWTFVNTSNDQVEKYSADGKLLSITSRSGVTQTLTYSTGVSNDTTVSRFPANAPACSNVSTGPISPADRLLCVTDSWGKQIQFEYDITGRIVKTIAPDNQVYTYAYDGPSGGCVTVNNINPACAASNLTSVTYPGGKTKTYHYNESALINAGTPCRVELVGNGFGSLMNSLTGITNEDGVRSLSWGYDCSGKAVMSQHADGIEKVTINYSYSEDGSNDVHSLKFFGGTTAAPTASETNWVFKSVLGVSRFVGTYANCSGCPGTTGYSYDANGNVISFSDFVNTTTFEFDLNRNLEIKRTRGAGSALALTTTTSWHPTYRLPVQVNQPLRRITYTYDAKGNILTRTEQATSDTNGNQGANAAVVGVPRTWTYTYNTLGQVLSLTGPRTDITSKTVYSYDSQGNLASITNALGHITTLSNYDANGRLGSITDPNGVVTNLSYSPRGWLTQRATTGGGITETTGYQYNGVGKITQITLPDQSVITLTYDAASRLIKISDSLGNSINYTLDIRGNRTAETVTDTGGNLTRKINRVFDPFTSDLTSISGGAQ